MPIQKVNNREIIKTVLLNIGPNKANGIWLKEKGTAPILRYVDNLPQDQVDRIAALLGDTLRIELMNLLLAGLPEAMAENNQE